MSRTNVFNNLATKKFFGFLPPHGKTLAAGETLVVDGDLRTILAGGRGRYGRPAELDSLNQAVADGDLILDPNLDSSSSA